MRAAPCALSLLSSECISCLASRCREWWALVARGLSDQGKPKQSQKGELTILLERRPWLLGCAAKLLCCTRARSLTPQSLSCPPHPGTHPFSRACPWPSQRAAHVGSVAQRSDLRCSGSTGTKRWTCQSTHWQCDVLLSGTSCDENPPIAFTPVGTPTSHLLA